MGGEAQAESVIGYGVVLNDINAKRILELAEGEYGDDDIEESIELLNTNKI